MIDVTTFREDSLDDIEFFCDWEDPFERWFGGELEITDYELMGRCLDVLQFAWEKSKHATDLVRSMKGPYELVRAEHDGKQGILLTVEAMPIRSGATPKRVRVFSYGTEPAAVYCVTDLESP